MHHRCVTHLCRIPIWNFDCVLWGWFLCNGVEIAGKVFISVPAESPPRWPLQREGLCGSGMVANKTSPIKKRRSIIPVILPLCQKMNSKRYWSVPAAAESFFVAKANKEKTLRGKSGNINL